MKFFGSLPVAIITLMVAPSFALASDYQSSSVPDQRAVSSSLDREQCVELREKTARTGTAHVSTRSVFGYNHAGRGPCRAVLVQSRKGWLRNLF